MRNALTPISPERARAVLAKGSAGVTMSRLVAGVDDLSAGEARYLARVWFDAPRLPADALHTEVLHAIASGTTPRKRAARWEPAYR